MARRMRTCVVARQVSHSWPHQRLGRAHLGTSACPAAPQAAHTEQPVTAVPHLVRNFMGHHHRNVTQVEKGAGGAGQQGGLAVRDHTCRPQRRGLV